MRSAVCSAWCVVCGCVVCGCVWCVGVCGVCGCVPTICYCQMPRYREDKSFFLIIAVFSTVFHVPPADPIGPGGSRCTHLFPERRGE